MLNIFPEGLLGAAFNVKGIATQLKAAYTAASAVFSAVVSPTSDFVSLNSTVQANLRTDAYICETDSATDDLQDTGTEVGKTSINYAATDILRSASYHLGQGQ